MAEQNNNTNASTNANGNSGGGSNTRNNNNDSNRTSTKKKKPKKAKKSREQQKHVKFKGNDSEFEGKVIDNKATMAKDFGDIHQMCGSICSKRGYDFLPWSIEKMQVKPDDCKEFKETAIKDMDMSEFSQEVEVNVEEDGKTPVMVTKTVVTNEILYRAESKKLEEENKEKRAKKSK